MAEFFAIFLAVSLSFVADDWRETLGDRREAERVLEGLSVDLDQDLAVIQQKVHLDSMAFVSEQWLQRNWLRPDVPLDSLTEAIQRGVFQGGTYVPIRSEYESAKSAGRLQLITNPDLRRAISLHYEGEQPFQQVVNRIWLDLDLEVWRGFRPYLEYAVDWEGSPDTVVPPVSLARPWAEVREDQVLRNTLVQSLATRRLHLLQMQRHALRTAELRSRIVERTTH